MAGIVLGEASGSFVDNLARRLQLYTHFSLLPEGAGMGMRTAQRLIRKASRLLCRRRKQQQ